MTRVALLQMVLVGALALGVAAAGRQEGGASLHRPLDELLDVHVRDGFVYYRALQADRGRLDRYLSSLDVAGATYDGWSREAKMAFWVNAYNAFVLRTVVNRYPIRGRSPDLPTSSIRQIPGAFDKTGHRAAGRTVTLDEIEKTILPEFKEPRLQLALGRGAVGSGRLRSEAYTADRLAKQLAAIQAEFVTEEQMVSIGRATGEILVTPILSWHDAAFIAGYDPGASGPYAARSPIERALIAFITPHLLPLERETIERNQFTVRYREFDWSLNDLTGGRK